MTDQFSFNDKKETPPGMVYWNQLRPIVEARVISHKDDYFVFDKQLFQKQKKWTSGIWAARQTGTDILNTSAALYSLDWFKDPFRLLVTETPRTFFGVFIPAVAITIQRNDEYYLLEGGKINQISFEEAESRVISFGRAVYGKLMHEAREVDEKFYRKHSHKLRG